MKIEIKNFVWKIKNGEIYFKDNYISFINVSDGEISTKKIEIEENKNYTLSFKFRVAIECFLKEYKNDYLSNFLKKHPFYWRYGINEASLKILFYNKGRKIKELIYPVYVTSTFPYWDFVKFKHDIKKGWVDSFIKIKTPPGSKFLKIVLKIKSKNEIKGGFGIGEIHLLEKEKLQNNYGKILIKTYDEKGKLTPSKISIYSFENKNYIIPPFEIFYEYPFPFFFNIDRETEFLLPEGRYSIDISKGFSYSLERYNFYLPAGTIRSIEVNFKKISKENWIASDHHVHLFGHFNTNYPFINDETFKKICQAEGLDFVMLGVNYVEWKKTKNEKDDILIEKGIELVSHKYGHFCLIGLNKKLKINDFPDPFKEYPPLWEYLKVLNNNKTGIVAAHPCQTIKVGKDIVKEEEKGLVKYVDDTNRWNLNKILPLLLLMHIPVGFDVIIGDGAGTIYTFLKEYFNLLNSGFKVAACGSTDSNVDMKNSFNPVGSARTYLYVKEKNTKEISMAYRKGTTFATNGPLIFPLIEKKYIPGDEILIEKPQKIKINFEVFSSFGLSFVECYYNGKIINRFEITGHKEWSDEFEININESGWLNFIVRGPGNKWINSWMIPEDERNSLGQICITTPFYIDIKNKPYKPPEELLKYYLKWLEKLKFLIKKFSLEISKEKKLLKDIDTAIKKYNN